MRIKGTTNRKTKIYNNNINYNILDLSGEIKERIMNQKYIVKEGTHPDVQQSTRIYSILTVVVDKINNGMSFSDAMKYCEERVLKNNLVCYYVNYVLRGFRTFGLRKYGAIITPKIVAEFISIPAIRTKYSLEELSTLMVINIENKDIQRVLNFIKLKDPFCKLVYNEPTPDVANQVHNLQSGVKINIITKYYPQFEEKNLTHSVIMTLDIKDSRVSWRLFNA